MHNDVIVKYNEVAERTLRRIDKGAARFKSRNGYFGT